MWTCTTNKVSIFLQNLNISSSKLARDAKLNFHHHGNRNVQLDYNPNNNFIEKREPNFVDYSKKGQYVNRLSSLVNDQPSSLDYSPNYSYVQERVRGGINMRKVTERDTHFHNVNEAKKQQTKSRSS